MLLQVTGLIQVQKRAVKNWGFQGGNNGCIFWNLKKRSLLGSRLRFRLNFFLQHVP
jgi:hypothetical protein